MSIFQLFVNSVRFAANIRERLVRYTPICHAYVVHPTQTKTNGKTMYLICVQVFPSERQSMVDWIEVKGCTVCGYETDVDESGFERYIPDDEDGMYRRLKYDYVLAPSSCSRRPAEFRFFAEPQEKLDELFITVHSPFFLMTSTCTAKLPRKHAVIRRD